jgi:hypothetical protein
MNGRDIEFTVDDAETLVLAVATSDLDVPVLADAIDARLR